MRYFAMFAALIVFAAPAEAQFRLTSINVGSGASAISSGLTGTVTFASENNSMYAEVTVQSEQVWGIYARNFSAGRASATIGGSVGYFQGAPLVGPYMAAGLELTNSVKLTGLYWPAVFPGAEPKDWEEDDTENPESINIGHFGMVGLQIGSLGIGVAGLDFLDEKTNWLPSAAYTLSLTESIRVTPSVTWNRNDREPMYFTGLTWTPTRAIP